MATITPITAPPSLNASTGRNCLLEKTGSPKRYKNLLGITLGTGFGGGIVCDGELLIGDNSIAGEVWLLRNKLAPQMNAEEGASIRAVRRAYATGVGIPFDQSPDPREFEQIALWETHGNGAAAMDAYRQLGEVAGDAMGNALTLIDGLAVIGGGLSQWHPLFLPTLVEELNGFYTDTSGKPCRRLASTAFNLEDPVQLGKFLSGDIREITVPGSNRKIKHDPLQRLGVGMSRLGTSEAVAVGAYAFALKKMS